MTANVAVAGQRITAAWLNTNIPGPWTAITPLNSWSLVGSGNAHFQARLFNSVTVQVTGIITGGTITAGTQIGTLPSGMIPTSTQVANGVVLNPSGEVGDNFEILVTGSTGNIFIYGVPTSSNELGLNFMISLDA